MVSRLKFVDFIKYCLTCNVITWYYLVLLGITWYYLVLLGITGITLLYFAQN